jgi:GrpB-like predicted nucleotidyltransferase (UPF0157 family)
MVSPHDNSIELVAPRHDEWRARFVAERDRIHRVLATYALENRLQRLEHVGSTTVRSLLSKDIVDLDVVVADDAVSDVSAAITSELGGDRSENTAEWHPVFRVHDGQRFNDHVFASSSDRWKLSVVTRDVLRARSELRREYERLKRELCAEHDDLIAYSEGKTGFIDRVIATARSGDDLEFDFELLA